ncbi:hypothetical protein RchiOBHm_Chr3g0460941 [Rosa chinensis]|uniref:Secreted protein n=1 Tax=Rosa chinensis TaxID=74649 RepID=A0A2P6R8K5_ROSCH|nr:hypothetical protein RchiOBHm_Chr3g0460941 [Rosa chinensis]
MCPLRFILILLSTTLAGFFLLRNIASENDSEICAPSNNGLQEPDASSSPSFSCKVASAMRSAFWTSVDMASGRYLWRTLVSSSSSVHSH